MGDPGRGGVRLELLRRASDPAAAGHLSGCLYPGLGYRQPVPGAGEILSILLATAGLVVLPKLLLSIQMVQTYPRLFHDVSGYSVHDLFYFLFSHRQNLYDDMGALGFPNSNYHAIDENSLYVGILPFLFLLLFFVKNRKEIKIHLPLVITLLIMVWIMLGSAITPSLQKMIQLLPVYSSFRVAQRFRFDFIIPFALLAGLGLDNMLRQLHGFKIARLLLPAALLLVFADLTLFSTNNFLTKTLIIKNPEAQLSRAPVFSLTDVRDYDFEIQRTIPIPASLADTIVFMPWSYEYLKLKENKGVIDCYDALTYADGAVGIENAAYRGEAYLEEPVAGETVENTFWSPNLLKYRLTGGGDLAENVLVIDQNFYPGWVVFTGEKSCSRAIKYNGLLAFSPIESGQSLTFEYNPVLYFSTCRYGETNSTFLDTNRQGDATSIRQVSCYHIFIASLVPAVGKPHR